MTKKQKQMLMKQKDLEYIKQFREISIRNVCSDLKVNYFNVMNGNASCRNIRRVRKEIEKQVEILLHRFD